HEVRLPEHLIERHPLRNIAMRMERPRDDAAADSLSKSGHFPADGARSDQSKRLAMNLRNHCPRPPAFPNLPIDLQNLPGGREHESERMLRDGGRRNSGRVRDSNSKLPRAGEIDVVRPGSPD